MAGKYTVEGVFGAKDRFSRVVGKMEGRFARFSRKMDRLSTKMSAGFSRIGSALKKVGFAAVAAGAAVGAALAHVVSTGADFETSMLAAATKFGPAFKKGTAEFERLSSVAKTIGETTEHSASTAAQGLNFLAMAGFDANQSMAALPGLVDLATAAQLDLGAASDIATDSLGAFNLMTKDSAQLAKNLARVNDVLSATSDAANTSVEAMFEAIKSGGPAATAAGASVEGFSALVGLLAGAGIKGEQGGTALRNMFLRLQAPPSEAAKALKKLGVETSDAEGNFRGMTPVLGDLIKSMEGMGTAEKAAKMVDIFGMRSAGAAQILMNQGVPAIEEFRKKLEGAAGSTARKAEELRGSFENIKKGLFSAFEAVELSIFEAIQPELEKATAGITEWVRKNKTNIKEGVAEMIPVLKELGGSFDQGFSGTLDAIGEGFASVFGKDNKTSLEEWKPLLKSFAKNLGQIAAFAVIVTAAVGAMAIGLVAAASLAFDTVKGAFKGFLDFIGAKVFAISDWFADLTAIFDAEGMSLGDKMLAIGKHVIQGLVDGFWSLMNAPKDALISIGKGAIAGFKSALGISSPSRLMAEQGAMVAKGLEGGILGGVALVDRAAQRLSDAVTMPRINAMSLGADLDDDDGPEARRARRPDAPSVVSPTASIAREIRETSHTSRGEITIRDESGRAAITKQPKGSGLGLKMQPSGA